MYRLIIVLAILSLAIVACGGDDAGEPATAAGANATATPRAAGGSSPAPGGPSTPTASGGQGSCEVNITGDVNASWKGGGGRGAIGASYWFSEAERGSLGKDELFLIVNCVQDSANQLNLLPVERSAPKDIPFGPGSYAITRVQRDAPGKPGEFTMLLGISTANVLWQAEPGGTVKITRFDRERFQATAEFTATEFSVGSGAPKKKVTVKATFDFKCVGGAC